MTSGFFWHKKKFKLVGSFVRVKIAVISDIHAGQDTSILTQRGHFEEILLLRTVRRLNRTVKPDITIIAGDLLENGNSNDAIEQSIRLREIIDMLNSPTIIIRGNHDLPAEEFYKIFGPMPDYVDINRCRFIPFDDHELPDFNAKRTNFDIERMKNAAKGFKGQVICVQHVPLFPQGEVDCPYSIVNSTEVIAAMKKFGINLSISGHWHEGFDLIKNQSTGFCAAPALYKEPFRFLEINLNDDEIKTTTHQLKIPEQPGLVDCHIHTQLAYCSENMDIEKTLRLARVLGLGGVIFTEHSSQLYFTQKQIENKLFFTKGLKAAAFKDDRMSKYFKALKKANIPSKAIGMEIDCDHQGRLILKNKHAGKVKFKMAAIHNLEEFSEYQPDQQKAYDEFLDKTEKFLQAGAKVLAHPFRVFSKTNQILDSSFYLSLAELLKKYSAAAELNFNHQRPRREFTKICLAQGVKISLGSDCHNLCQVGELNPHLDFLADCGFNGDLKDILTKENLKC